jgi:hypothetical protein
VPVHCRCLAVASLLLAVLVPAQQPAAGAEPTAWLPLQPGARWVYAVERAENQGWVDAGTSTVTAEIGGTLADGRRVHQLRVEATGERAPRFEQWSVEADGVRRFSSRDPFVRGAIDAGAAPMQWLSLPAAPSTSWQWQGPHDLVADPEGLSWSHEAAIVAPDARIGVPAGGYRATHVRVASKRNGTVQPRSR